MFSWQDQILIGTVLGGSSLVKPPKGKNCYLSMRNKNEKWLQYKMEGMGDYFKTPKIHKYGESYRCNSSCCPKLTELRSVLYNKNNRMVSIDVLDPMQSIGLAIWYLDGGGKTGRGKKNVYINTTKFGEDGSEIVREYFDVLFHPRWGACSINRNGLNRWRVLLDVGASEKFLSIIAHHLPSFMLHKL